MANQSGIAISIVAFLPTGKTLDEQYAALTIVKSAHETGDYSALLKASLDVQVKTEQKTRRVEAGPTPEQIAAEAAAKAAAEAEAKALADAAATAAGAGTPMNPPTGQAGTVVIADGTADGAGAGEPLPTTNEPEQVPDFSQVQKAPARKSKAA